MASFLERLRAALADRYEVEREIGRGGMGTVFLARDPRLKRAVAIKALRPEDYTAVALARFQQEAQLLAQLSHSNIVPIYDTGIAAGIPWYVMELLTGETLEARLGGGNPEWYPLSSDDIPRLGLDLLAALDFAHRAGVVHRDVKPANIIFRRAAAVLTDFGIAKSLAELESDTLRTEQGQLKGTLAFMSPEQRVAKDATPRSDLYSAAVVLYLAYTGILRTIADPPDLPDTGVPPRMRPVLARALQVEPADRWPDAATFRAAWEEATAPQPVVPAAPPPLPPHAPRWRQVASGAVAAVLAVIAYLGWRPPPPRPLPSFDVVLAPFTTNNTADLALGREVALLAGLSLSYFPHIHVVDAHAALNCWERAEAETVGFPRATCRERTRARFVIEGAVTGRGDSVDVRLNLFDTRDHPGELPLVTGLARAPDALTSAVATAALRALVAKDSTLGPVDSVTITFCGRRADALAAFSRGEDAFRHDDWLIADDEYQRALTLDPSCALAAWRLGVVRAWRRMPVGVDLRRLYDRQRAALPPAVRALLAAQLAPSGPERLAAYRTAVAAHPGESYAWLLFGNELWSRGALAGVGLLAADTALGRAVVLDRSAPVYDHIAWLNIRLGNARAARVALDSIPPGLRGDVDLPRLLELAYVLRFTPASAKIATPPPDMLNDIAKAVRFGLTVDVPDGQVRFGQLLAAAQGITSDQRADGHEAQAVALIMLGRTDAALLQFDSAAALRGPIDRIEPAEWRLLLGQGSLPAPAAAEVARGRNVIERLVNDRAVGARAAWDLAVAAYALRDTTGADRWARAFHPHDPEDSVAGRALSALALGASGRLSAAVAAARPLGWIDADHLRRYPFLRSLVHLSQGAWLAELGDSTAADSAWGWYDNADASQWPIGPAQAGDVDWALASWGRLLRARLNPKAGACGAKRVAELWAGADSGYAPLRAEAHALGARCRS
jgi:hypothetical protein